MSQYIVSARKYRPDSFETLLGQDNIARTLSNSIKRGQLAHAYLFCGPRGVGKTTTARIFAKMINCAHPGPDMEPCGECESCVSFQEGRSYCIHELDAASNNGVDDIKALIEKVQVPPQVGKYSVYIIDEVHMLSQAAFNAFLKTLEEPPAHAVFVLATTEKHKILPTILSRCQTYDFNRIGIPDMVRNLRGIAAKEGVSIDDESLHVIAAKADGAMRDALTIFDQTVAFCGTDIHYEDVIRNLNVLDYEYSFGMVENFLSGSYAAALSSFDEILSKGFNALHFVAALSSHFRDLVVARTAGLDSLLELPDSLKQRYREQAARCPLQFLYDALNITTACEAGYKAAVNPRLHIEFALMKLSFLTGQTDVSLAPRPVAVPKPAPADKTAVAPKPVPAAPVEAPAIKEAAPAATPAPAPAPGRQRRVPKTGSALSMSAIMEEKQEAPVEQAPTAAEETLPTDETVKAGWKELINKYQTLPRLASALAKAELRMTEENGVKSVFFPVSNAAQKQWIEEKILRDLETSFREILSCRKVNVHVDDIPEEEPGEKKPYMPEEKAKDLMDKHPEVRAFVADLGLDTK
jgi:DNA polymerase-3 subunit gamma/tau